MTDTMASQNIDLSSRDTLYKWRRCTDPLILKLHTRWQWVVNVTPKELFPEERTPVRALGGNQSRFGCFRNNTKLLTLPVVEPEDGQPPA